MGEDKILTPNTRGMRAAWVARRVNEHGENPLVADGEFDRFMGRYRAEAVREAAARAFGTGSTEYAAMDAEASRIEERAGY